MTNNPTEQQATPTSEEELREKLIKLTGEMHDIGFYSYSEETDYVRLNEIDDAIMQLLTSEVEKAKLEGSIAAEKFNANALRPFGYDESSQLSTIEWVCEELSKLQEEQ